MLTIELGPTMLEWRAPMQAARVEAVGSATVKGPGTRQQRRTWLPPRLQRLRWLRRPEPPLLDLPPLGLLLPLLHWLPRWSCVVATAHHHCRRL